MTVCFYKNSHLDLGPRALELELVQDIVVLNIYVKQNQNQLINKGARVMTKVFLEIVTATLTLTLSR